jgi:hypothetical protein
MGLTPPLYFLHAVSAMNTKNHCVVSQKLVTDLVLITLLHESNTKTICWLVQINPSFEASLPSILSFFGIISILSNKLVHNFLLIWYLLTPRYRIFFQKLLATQLVKQPAFFMEPKGSLPCSQKPTTGPYSKPDESSSPHWSLSP